MTQQEKSTHPERAETTPTRFVNAGEVLFAYRRFGNPAGTPLVFLQHFRGSMDNWDPALLNCFAKDRLVITFDNAGVAPRTSIRRSLKQRQGLPPETGCSGSSLNQPQRVRRQEQPSGIGC